MCYNKDISLEVYLTTCALSLILYLTGDKYDKHIALFSIVFIHMQLRERTCSCFTLATSL